jgi:uncharacterized protein
MLIGIISDTHDIISGMEQALAVFKKRKVKLVLHCGDWITPDSVAFFHKRCAELQLPLKGAWGNNDVVAQALAEQEELYGVVGTIVSGVLDLRLEGRHLAVCHGHDKELLSATIESQDFDAVCTGHTHRAKVTKFGETLIINPGSTAFEMPFNKQNITTVGIYDTKTNSADIVELD